MSGGELVAKRRGPDGAANTNRPTSQPWQEGQAMTGYATKERTGKVSRAERGSRRAMLRRADEVNVFAGFDIGFIVGVLDDG